MVLGICSDTDRYAAAPWRLPHERESHHCTARVSRGKERTGVPAAELHLAGGWNLHLEVLVESWMRSKNWFGGTVISFTNAAYQTPVVKNSH